MEQEEKSYNKYVQKFKKVARRSSYKRWSLIEEFKRRLNRTIRRKLTKVESPPTTIEEWQKRAVRLNRNQRQSRAEKRLLERNVAYPRRNTQPRRGYEEGSWGYRREQSVLNWERNQMGPRRDLDAMDMDRGKEGDKICYICRK